MNKVFLHSTYDCNAHCIHCAVPRRKDYMDLSLFERMVEEIPMEFLVIGGGEPLKHPDLEKMINMAHKKTKVKIETNGALLNKEFLKRNRNKLFQINTSVDGTEDIHNSIRGIDTFKHTTEMIRYARELGIDVAIWFAVMKKNVSEIEDTISLSKDLGVDKLSFLYATPVGKCDFSMTVPNREYSQIVEKVKKMETEGLQIRIAPYTFQKTLPFTKDMGCLINDEEILHVDPSGDIYPCVLLLDNPLYKLGSIQEGYTPIKVEDPSICAGLIESLGEDSRRENGTPVCPCKTITKEWHF
jgi:MoaA/NifB/PqqE/SkfB family radical SAM enzyme